MAELGDEDATSNGKKESTDKESYPSEFLSVLTGIHAAIRDLIPEKDEAKSRRQEEREDADLKAQQSMADAACWMIWIGVCSLVLTGAGVLLIWRTLHHTKKAAEYAKVAAEAATKTVEEAKEATAAARQANETSREIFAATERPWVFAIGATANGGVSMDPEGGILLNARVEIKNCGRVPALCVDIDAEMHTPVGEDALTIQRRLKNKLHENFLKLPDYSVGVLILPQGETKLGVTIRIPPADIASITGGDGLFLSFVGAIRFRSPIDQTMRYTGFGYVVRRLKYPGTEMERVAEIPVKFTSFPAPELAIASLPVGFNDITDEEEQQDDEADQKPTHPPSPG